MARRSAADFAGRLLAALFIGLGTVGFLFLAFAALFIWASNQPGGGEQGDPPRAIAFEIQVGAPSRAAAPDVDLHLGAADVAALELGSSVVIGEKGTMHLTTPLTDVDLPSGMHCLLAPADLVEKVTGGVVVTIPAGICLGNGDLVVPTAAAPEFVTDLETVAPSGSGERTTVTGELVVRYDGCATIGGRRAIWSNSPGVDAEGSVITREGTLANGAVVAVRTTVPYWQPTGGCPGGPPLIVEGIA